MDESAFPSEERQPPVFGQPETSHPEPGFLPAAPPRAAWESIVVRLVATAGVIGIGTGIGAILASQEVAGWITALVVATLSVILAAILWRSRRL